MTNLGVSASSGGPAFHRVDDGLKLVAITSVALVALGVFGAVKMPVFSNRFYASCGFIALGVAGFTYSAMIPLVKKRSRPLSQSTSLEDYKKRLPDFMVLSEKSREFDVKDLARDGGQFEKDADRSQYIVDGKLIPRHQPDQIFAIKNELLKVTERVKDHEASILDLWKKKGVESESLLELILRFAQQGLCGEDIVEFFPSFTSHFADNGFVKPEVKGTISHVCGTAESLIVEAIQVGYLMYSPNGPDAADDKKNQEALAQFTIRTTLNLRTGIVTSIRELTEVKDDPKKQEISYTVEAHGTKSSFTFLRSTV